MHLRLFSDFSHKHFVTYSQSLPKDATGGYIPGITAKQPLSDFVFGKVTTMREQTRDRYGRLRFR